MFGDQVDGVGVRIHALMLRIRNVQNRGTSAKLLVTCLCVRCASICKSDVLRGSETCGCGLRFWYLRIWSRTVWSKPRQRSSLVPRQVWRLSRSEGQGRAWTEDKLKETYKNR